MNSITPEILGVVAALLISIAVFESLRRGILPERFSALWIILSVVLVILAVFPRVGTWVSDVLGVEVPSNLLFFFAAVLLLLVSIQFSYEIGKLDARTRRLAEELALVRHGLDHFNPPPSDTADPGDSPG